jgi:hypothetical protein
MIELTFWQGISDRSGFDSSVEGLDENISLK